jgi:hypothetical protein
MAVTLDVDVLSAKHTGIFIARDRHRLLIGWIGLLLPIFLFVAVMIRPTPDLPTFLHSLSAYYYSSGIAVLEGTLAALALFLLAYQGYPNNYQWADQAAAKLAGTAALFIALCPTYPPGYPHPPASVPAPPWWTEIVGQIHDWSSAVMFLMFAIFSLVLFRLTDQKKEDLPRGKRLRDHLYLACGVAIVVCSVMVGYRLKTGNTNVLLPEWGAIGAFSISWLVKGGVLARWLPD